MDGNESPLRLENLFPGSLFAGDFLCEAIGDLNEWKEFDDASLDALENTLREFFGSLPLGTSPNESQTEDEIIWPVLDYLGWKSSLRQQNLSERGREDVPDGLMFESEEAKTHANGFPEWKRYEFGLAIVESKRWKRPLDRPSGSRSEETAPSTQMLRYLRRVDDRTIGKLRWGILTNGAQWRLYFAGARSVSEQFFEIDLARVLNLPGYNDDLFALPESVRRHWLKVFALMFRREAFLPTEEHSRTFHERSMDEGRRYEERVTDSLYEQIFQDEQKQDKQKEAPIFPQLLAAIVAAAPDAPLPEVREAVLVILYRLLFILYAEDRNLLPVRDDRYDDYGLRNKVRDEVGRRMDSRDTFSESFTNYWSAFDNLCRAIDGGDASIGLPPYNGGLFDPERTPLLDRIRLSDQIMANVIDALSFEKTPQGRRYINYRDLGVQQLGSIYERLLEQEPVFVESDIEVRLSPFARKGSGSYYTPDDLVGLIIEETVEPLIRIRKDAFGAFVSDSSPDMRMEELERLDPAEKILELKICDPAMGSGHFLVNLVDYLADRVIEAMADAEAEVEGYASPLNERIAGIRKTILARAGKDDWRIDPAQLDDRNIIRRMVLKRCVYGVDKSPMAVELAKVALWLHTFTVGAPLSFLDHHLRCGDSLFGSWVRAGIDKAGTEASLFLHEPIRRATAAASPMQEVESLTDAEIAEAHESAERFTEVGESTKPLDAFLSLLDALEWLNPRSKEDKAALRFYYLGQFGDPVEIALRNIEVPKSNSESVRFSGLLEKALLLIDEERFLHWQVAFPGVWSEWESTEREGGFDAVIGNPPWDRVKLQQVEWFAARRPEIARAARASDRKRMIANLVEEEDPLARDFAEAGERAMTAARMARSCGDYPLLSRGDVNLYSLFVERAMSLVKPEGMIGLLTPSGIASDKTAARFFKGVATEGRLKALYDFENKKIFFPDVHASFKFCVFVASPSQIKESAKCAFYLHNVSELKTTDSKRCFSLSAEDFASVNPNTGTAPIFRTERDAELTTAIYDRLPVLVDRSSGEEAKAWPVKYSTMFHMTNDSNLFRTREELEENEGAWAIGGNLYQSDAGDWVPLYEGKMVQAFDHRAAQVVVNPENRHRPAQPQPATLTQHKDPNWLPAPQYWIPASECSWPSEQNWILGFKEITAPTNIRTLIAALFPAVAFGNKVPILKPETAERDEWLLAANLNATILDFVTRQKVQGQTLNLFIVEQLPVVPPETYEIVRFGTKTAGEIVCDAVLELTYTAHDMAPFARDMGHVDEEGDVRPPFVWDEERRLHLRAKLDAVFFHLYGVTDRDDVRYIYSTFPIVEREETKAYGDYRSRDLCLSFMNSLAAGVTDVQFSS